MKITELTPDVGQTPFTRAVLKTIRNQQRQLLLRWTCDTPQELEAVKRFLRHFDATIGASGTTQLDFTMPLGTLKSLYEHAGRFDDSYLIDSIEELRAKHVVRWACGRKNFDVTSRPIVYAILNVTPDSFYDGGRYDDSDAMAKQVDKMAKAGADVIEVGGGQTTKPGFKEVTPEEEIKRISPAINLIHRRYPQMTVAVDTYKLPVMKKAIEMGVDIINDVQAFNTPEKRKLMAQSKCGLVTMHNSRDRKYSDLTREMSDFFEENLADLSAAGVDLDRVCLDEGIGYAKEPDGKQDFAMMRSIDQFNYLRRPMMIAISRKAFAKNLFGLKEEDRLPATLVAETAMFLRGGRVIRVHDVEETVQLVKTLSAIGSGYWFGDISDEDSKIQIVKY